MIARRIIRADLSQDLNNLCFLANQYDDYSRKYRVIITNNGVLQPFTAQKPIRLIMKVQGESAPYYDDYLKSDEWEDGFPVVTFTASMLSKVGNVDFQFIIYEPGSPASVSTRQQHLKIQESLIDYDGIIASEEFNFLTDLISQATTIPALINDINTSITEVNAKISQVNTKMAQFETQMQTYAIEFTEMQSEQQAVIDALHAYMTNVENAAAASAKNSESWAVGGTSTRPGENTNNSKYFSEQASASADRAEQYAGNVDPKMLSQINGIDSSGLLGEVGATVVSQPLVNELARRVSTDLIPYTHIINNGTSTSSGFVLDARQANPNETNSLANKIINLDSKYNDYLFVNVKYNGVMGDGVTDDSDAINALLEDYDTIYFPSGVYKVTKTLICKENTHIFGNGKIKTTMQDGFVIKAQGVSIENKTNKITIEGIMLEGTPVKGENSLTGIYCSKCKNIIINNVTIEGFNQSVRISESEDIKIINCKMRNNIKTSDNINGYGCLTQDTKNLLIDGCIIEAERHSVYLYLFNNAVVSNCEIYGINNVTTPTGYELPVKFAGGSCGVVENCHIHTAFGGIEVADNQDNTVGSKNVFIKNCLFTNKTINPSRSTGWIYSFETLSDNINIDNCIFHDTTDRVIVIEGGYRHYLTNCKIYNDNSTPSTASCIRMNSIGDTATMIAHNNFIDGFSVLFDLQSTSTAVMYAYNTVIKNVSSICPESNWKYVQIIGTRIFGSFDMSDIETSTFDATGYNIATLYPNTTLTTIVGGELGQSLTIKISNSGAKISNSGNILINGTEITSGTNKAVLLIKTTPQFWTVMGIYQPS